MDDRETFRKTGRVWLRRCLSEASLSRLDGLFDQGGLRGRRLAGPRDVETPELTAALSRFLAGCFAVRAVLFDKSDDRNWSVPWHQDRVIAVRDRHDTALADNWSRKAGQWHCEPAPDILERMLFVRLFLDDVDAAKGGMEMALGSHHLGRVAADQVEAGAQDCAREVEQAQRGDVLVMHMLMVHRSTTSSCSTARRVIRADFANAPLPAPLEWLV